MAITITLANDDNHSVSSSKKILSRQGELGETITFSLPSTLNAAYPRAWIMVQQPDGQLFYIDNGSGAGFTWPNPYTFTYNIGDRDTMLSSDGTLGIQIVLRDATPPAQTVEWRSRILYLTIEGSILSNVDSGGSLIDSLSSGTLDRLADILYDSLADGDLLYRDTATGKWRNVTLVDGANISHVLNKTTGELTLQATGNISTLASDLVYTDAGGYYAGSDGETISQEIGASLALKAPLASPALTGTPTAPTAGVGTDTTQLATTGFVKAQEIGKNQTWQDVTASRTFNVTYTNTTGKPIMVAISAGMGSSVAWNMLIDGTAIAHIQGAGEITVPHSETVIVPAGSTYAINRESAYSTITYWKELR